ncbi:MAG TPA: efflux RND transporter permease subunit [Patescibacteria group bacterium]|jgi:HAE1 family hydrophobic/amphiphilic exporter-1|nr:efflux RND transporter permease subunit [Patescibacteria group bacterium]
MINSKLGTTARIVKFFLEQKQLTAILLAIIVIVGAGSFWQLHVEGFPEITVPIAVVSTVVPGAGPETINDTVTVPVENALRDLKGVKEVTSTSQTNASVVLLSFNEGVDVNLAIQDARTKLASVTLPEGVKEPTIFVPDTGGAPFTVAVSGPKTLLDLKTQAKELETKLLAVKGVKSFTDISGVSEKIYIELPPQYQLPAITQQIQTANIGFPLGQSAINGKEIPVSGAATLHNLEDVRNIAISIPAQGEAMPARIAKLGDIASVYIGYDAGKDIHRVGYLDDADNKFKIQPALLYEIRLESDADILSVGKEVEKVVSETRAPDGKSDYTLMFNQAKDAQNQVDEIVHAAIGSKWDTKSPIGYVGYLFGGIWLLIIGMLLFLDWRSAIISALSIPLSFLFTFITLNLMGVHMNTLVLFSFILVLGLIVDPAIVVLESIKRYMEIGLKGKSAVLRSIDVIGLGLFIAVLTSMIVFIPFSIVGGTFGQIIKYIPITVFPALIASYFVPLIFLTWAASKFLKAKPTDHLHDEDDIHTLWPIARWFIRTNRYVLKHTWLQIVVIILGLAIPIGVSAALFASGQIRQVQFAKPDDVQFMQISVPRPSNQTDSQLAQQTADVENILKDHVSEIQNFFYKDLGGASSSDTLSVFITLKDPKDRDAKSPEIAKRLQDQLKAKFGDRSLALEFGAGPPEDSYPVSVKVFENDPEKLKAATQKIAEQLRSYNEVAGVITDSDQTSNELVVTVDQEKTAARGVSAASVYGQVAALLGEKTLYNIDERDVVLRVPTDAKPTTVEALQSVEVFGPAGPVKVGDVATVKEEAVPGSIRRAQGDRYAQVSARLNDSRDAINVQREITDWSKSHTQELGVSDRAFEDRTGVNEFEKSFQQLFLAIALSILVTYVVFVVFFRSFLQPLIILFAVPLILIGVFPALAFFAGGQFGFLETIGILMVIGIAENVGIFLIDYANRKVKEGMDKKEAIAIASGIRFRPIILTKVTALAGLLPLAVFSPFWRGLSIVVIFGILSSGILSLFTTPVLYSWLTRRKNLVVQDDPDNSDGADNGVNDNQPSLPFVNELPDYYSAPTNTPATPSVPTNLPLQ